MIRTGVGLFVALGVAAQFAVGQSQASANKSALAHSESQTTPDSSSNVNLLLEEFKVLLQKQATELESQRRLLETQQAEIEDLRRAVIPAQRNSVPAAEQEHTAAYNVALLRSGVEIIRRRAIDSKATPAPALNTTEGQSERGMESGETPLSIHFGKARLTPGGWVDFTAIYRSTDVGSGLGTSFATIPFSDTVQGGLSETRFTAQGSRLSLRADEKFGAVKVFGYAEADFNGYLPSNAYVSTNSDSLRLRVYFTDLKRGRWELLAGQSWSMLTPNRVRVSPFLSEIYNTLHLDTNYQVGLTYARQTQLRAVYHLNDNVALGFSAENPEQFSGGAVTFPALFSSTETDLGSGTGAGGATATPTVHPDLIAKLSVDTGWAGHEWHFETAGLLTGVGILTPASITKSTSVKDIRDGGGISASANMEVVRNVNVILTGFWSDGGGRYIGGLGPAFVVAQRGATTSPFSVQMLHSGSVISGLEWRPNRKNLLAFTYSNAYFARAFSIDPSTGTKIGYGFTGSANSNNRVMQESTLGTQTTLWSLPGYGSVQVITQSSYIERAPWYSPPGNPKDAHVFAGYANLRYILP